jgi:hypothetical protein
MLTYVVTRTEKEFDDFCDAHQLQHAKTRLVQSLADVADADMAEHRIVLHGRCYELDEIDEILAFVIGRRAPVEMPRRLPKRSFGA